MNQPIGTRRSFLKSLGVGVALFGLGSRQAVLSTAAAAKKDNRKPNFVIIFTDDQGYGDLGCYGSQTIRSPRLDQLAKDYPVRVASNFFGELATHCQDREREEAMNFIEEGNGGY